MANEFGVAEGWMMNQFTTDPALTTPTDPAYVTGVYSEKAPRSQKGFYITWKFQGSPDVAGMGANRIAVEPLFLVTVHGRVNSYKELEAAANRVDALLDGQHGVYQGHRVAACTREGLYALTENADPIEWRRLGGYYRFYIVVG